MTVNWHRPTIPAPSRGDLALAAALAGVAILSGLSVDPDRPDTIEPSTLWQWLVILAPPALVAVRRVNPTVVAIAATVAQTAIWVSGLPEVLLPIIVILYTAASEAGRRGFQVAVGASVTLTIVTAIGVRVANDVTTYQLPLIALTCGTAVVLGANASRQRQITEDLATTIAERRLRSEHELTRAVAEERSHIAKELHDIIGHTLTVIAVRAEAADRVSEKNPAAAATAVAPIAAVARAALDETRQVLAGLRASSAVELAPPPDLDATRRLVTDLAAAGVAIQFTENGCLDCTPPALIGGGAYRIVQESLTNAIKHGGPAVSIEVRLDCSPNQLEIQVTNTVGTPSDTTDLHADGAGLIGMTERAAVLGGRLEVGPVADTFVVRAVLPMRTSSHQERRQ